MEKVTSKGNASAPTGEVGEGLEMGCVTSAGIDSNPCVWSGIASAGSVAVAHCSLAISECPYLYCHELCCALLHSLKLRWYSCQLLLQPDIQSEFSGYNN